MTPEQGPSPQLGLRGLVVPLVLVLLVGTALFAWVILSAVERRNVDISWAGPVTCKGTEVRNQRLDGHRVPVVPMRESMDCTLRVRVTSHAQWPVRLERVVLPYLGPSGRAAIRSLELAGHPVRRKHAVDAIFDVDHTLRPGATREIDIHMEFRPGGCNSPGSVTTLNDLPTIRVSSLGRSGIQAAEEIFAVRGTTDSSCDG